MRVRISVIVLTYNRAAMLADCLAALESQTRPPDEILVIDNGSTDSTRAYLNRAASESKQAGGASGPLPVLRVLDGPATGGWSAARNLGVREATGDWVAFTDDDCLPAPDWVERIEALAGRQWDAVGGPVEPAEALPWPWWWHPEISWCIGLSVPILKKEHAGTIYYPQTANWASRKTVLLREPFQEIPSDFSGGIKNYVAGREDAELWRRLRQKGYQTLFDSDLRVAHRISRRRLRWRLVARRAWLDGVALQRRQAHPELLAAAASDLVELPMALLLDIWGRRHAPWREAAWKIIWAIRQGGQWREDFRQKGFWRSGPKLAWMAAANLLGRCMGFAKRTARRIGVALARSKRHTRAPIRKPRNITVAAAGYLGDMVLLHPFLEGLKMRRPEVSLTLLTNRFGEEIYRHDPFIHNLVVLERRAATLRSALASSLPELILVPYFYHQPPAPLFALRKTRVVTFSHEVGFSRQWWYDMADRRVLKRADRPEISNLYGMFKEAGFEGPLPHLPLAFLAEEVETVRAALESRGLHRENLVLLAPGTAKRNKLWPEERWAEMHRYLIEEYHLQVVFVGSPDEEALCRRIVRLSGAEAAVECRLSIREMALWLAEARLLLSVDNGAKHLAAAMETPTLALFGPCSEIQWGAFRDAHKHGVVRGCAWDLTPEERIGLPADHQMRCITVSQVQDAVDEMLAER